MEGSNRRQCNNGEWDGEKPVCFGLNQENAYAREYKIFFIYNFNVDKSCR